MEKPVNPDKVRTFLASLNAGLETPVWVDLQGTHGLMKMDIKTDGSVHFSGTEGFPTKGFLNTKTGEIKTFSARIFS